MTKHEELYSLFQQGEEVSRRISVEVKKLHNSVLYCLFSRTKNDIYGLIKQEKKLAGDFKQMLSEVLLSSHGISADNIVGNANAKKFRIRINRKLHEVKPQLVDNRFVFFVDEVALAEDEKITDMLKTKV